MKQSPLKDKSAKFADRIIKRYKYQSYNKSEHVISKQILRSGTSIGANLSESSFASSKKDFLVKVQIAAKECSETIFWLAGLKNGGFITEQEHDSIYADCMEIGRMLSATIQTTKLNLGAK